jgi:hypothetical protein
VLNSYELVHAKMLGLGVGREVGLDDGVLGPRRLHGQAEMGGKREQQARG